MWECSPPEEGRLLASDVFNREFRKIGAAWVKQPITLTLAGIQNSVIDNERPDAKHSLLQDARNLMTLREELAAQEQELVNRRMTLARRYYREPERVAVPNDEFDAWFASGDSQAADGPIEEHA